MVNRCYAAEVISQRRLTPAMLRIELGGGELGAFVTSGRPDEWVRLVLPSETGAVTVPDLVDGRWHMPADQPRSPMRPYTVRRWCAETRRMTIDFVVHQGGAASDWAMAARPGSHIALTSPRGRFEPPADAETILLLSDATGLPAVGRILDEHRHLKTHAHVEIPALDDIQHELEALGDITWHAGFGQHAGGTTRLDTIARTVAIPAGCGYIYIAGEAKVASAIREYFRDDLGFDKERIVAIGYWIEGRAPD
jgi:NADPH-dependent ferric siderophore reductase